MKQDYSEIGKKALTDGLDLMYMNDSYEFIVCGMCNQKLINYPTFRVNQTYQDRQ